MIIEPASRLGQIQEYYFSRKLREIRSMNAAGKEVLNLGIGSPDLAPATDVIEELAYQSQQTDAHSYQSYVGIPSLRVAFAQWYRDRFEVDLNPEEEVLPLIGSKEGIMHISMTFLESGDEVLIPNPGYPAYRTVAQLTGARVRPYLLAPENGWLPDLEILEKEDLSRVKIMWINYPNMPTGANADINFFERLIHFARRNRILICNDNPYAFILNDRPLSILKAEGAKEVCLELNSLSKAHNMAGWRVGMIAGRKEYLTQILRFKSNMDSGMFKPLQMAAVKALQQPLGWYQALNDEYGKRRQLVCELLQAIDCQYTDNQSGLFVWAKTSAQYSNGFDLSDKILYDAHVFLTPGGIFGSQGNQYIRVSLCNNCDVLNNAIERVKDI